MPLLCLGGLVSGQNFFISGKAGYAYTDHQRPNYSKSGHIPLTLSVGFGLRNVQIGGDLILPVIRPETYVFRDEFIDVPRLREEIEDTYYGGFIRYNSSSNPQKKAGFILKAGAGMLYSKKIIYILPENKVHETAEYEPALQFTGEMGFSIPLAKILHIYIGAGVNYTTKEIVEYGVSLESFDQLKYIGQMGLSFNFGGGERGPRGGGGKQVSN